MLNNLEIAQDELDAEVVQCWGRSDSFGSSPLSLISSLQLDELELELEDHLEGPLLLLG
jgi:surfactin synthase thioesterase subunit